MKEASHQKINSVILYMKSFKTVDTYNVLLKQANMEDKPLNKSLWLVITIVRVARWRMLLQWNKDF